MKLSEIAQELRTLAMAYAMVRQIAPSRSDDAGGYLALDVARLANRIEDEMTSERVQADERERDPWTWGQQWPHRPIPF